jgi:transcriptional regulator with XRE-family HTH domain
MTLGQHIRQLRDMKSLSQDELGKLADVPQSVIADVESGRQATVTLDIAKRLADALAVTLESLVGNGEAFWTPDPGGLGPEASETSGRGKESQP